MNGLQHQLNEDQIKQIAKKAHGFVGADLGALSNEAAHICLKRSVEAGFTFENKFQITVSSKSPHTPSAHTSLTGQPMYTL